MNVGRSLLLRKIVLSDSEIVRGDYLVVLKGSAEGFPLSESICFVFVSLTLGDMLLHGA